MKDELLAEALALQVFTGAKVIDAPDRAAYATEYGVRGWKVFPLREKAPAIPNPHPKGSPERLSCKGECGLDGHGVLDATTDLDKIAYWWSKGNWNIGARVPTPLMVIDFDPRSGGAESREALRAKGLLPETLRHVSGRGDGGDHWFYRRPKGNLTAARLGPGVDLKTDTGYVVVPPSIHPDSRKPYTRVEQPIALPANGLIALMLPEPKPPKPSGVERLFAPQKVFTGPSIADEYTNGTSWSEVLAPHGWRCLDGDPDGDGARWRHPTATAPHSATIRHGLLFVYSSNTPFDQTATGDTHGYTRFKAYAVLNHDGDMSAAARALRGAA